MPTVKKASKKVATKLAAKKKTGNNEASPVKKTVKTTKKLRSASTGPTASKKLARKAKKPGTGTKRATPSLSINFADGTDMRTAFEEVQKGGSSRGEVAQRLATMWKNHPTRTGREKPVSTIINHVVRRARANGYEIQQTWKLVKVDDDAPVKASKKTTKKLSAHKVAKPGRKALKRRTSA